MNDNLIVSLCLIFLVYILVIFNGYIPTLSDLRPGNILRQVSLAFLGSVQAGGI